MLYIHLYIYILHITRKLTIICSNVPHYSHTFSNSWCGCLFFFPLYFFLIRILRILRVKKKEKMKLVAYFLQHLQLFFLFLHWMDNYYYYNNHSYSEKSNEVNRARDNSPFFSHLFRFYLPLHFHYLFQV